MHHTIHHITYYTLYYTAHYIIYCNVPNFFSFEIQVTQKYCS